MTASKLDEDTQKNCSYSPRQVCIRRISGHLVCYGLAIPLIIISVLAIPYGIVESYEYYYSANYQKNLFLLYLSAPITAMTAVWAGVTLFQWGKHLTRPNSQEFV